MKVIETEALVTKQCSCGVTLKADVNDIGDNMHDAGYGFSCPKCGRYHSVVFKELPESIQRELGRRETGH